MKAWLLSLSVVVALAACSAEEPQAKAPKSPRNAEGAQPDSKRPPKLIYSWVDKAGHIRMADSLEQVPLAARPRVVITDTARPRAERIAADEVLVVDLRAQGMFSPVDLTRPKSVDLNAPPPEPAASGIILYSAPWCGFCKKAAAHLKARGLRFAERNIDADPTAALELKDKLRQAKISGAGIPVLDVHGTLVVGFDKKRIDALLDSLGGGP